MVYVKSQSATAFNIQIGGTNMQQTFVNISTSQFVATSLQFTAAAADNPFGMAILVGPAASDIGSAYLAAGTVQTYG